MPRPLIATLLLGFVATACTSEADPTAPATRARVDPEAAGSHCPDGGVALRTGLAPAGTTTLAADGATTTLYLCKLLVATACPTGPAEKIVQGPLTLPIGDDDPLAQDRVQGVTCVDGDLYVLNTNADAIPQLGSLATVTGNLAIAGNPRLGTLDGMPSLRTVGGTLALQGNDVLGELSALATVTKFGRLAIVANPLLPDLGGLEAWTTIPGALLVDSNPELATLAGLDAVTSAHAITLHDNHALADLGGLAKLATAESLDLSGNPLGTLALPALASVTGDVSIGDNGSTTITAPVLTSVGGTFAVDGNATLATVAMPQLAAAGELHIASVPVLATLALPVLSSLGTLELTEATSLSAIAVPNLAALTTLHLDRVGVVTLAGLSLGTLGTLELMDCPSLTNLVGLGAITKLETFAIMDTGVASLEAMAGLAKVTGDFTFTGNALRGAAVTELVTHVAIGGSVATD